MLATSDLAEAYTWLDEDRARSWVASTPWVRGSTVVRSRP